MDIRLSAAIRQNYNEISRLCHDTKGPVYLTKNGGGDFVVMDLVSFTRREKMLQLQEELVAVEEDRLNSQQGKASKSPRIHVEYADFYGAVRQIRTADLILTKYL